MTLEARIYQALAPFLANRVFPLKAPPDTPRPYCVQTPISTAPTYTCSGDADSDRRVMQLDIYSDDKASYDVHVALSGKVRSVLEEIGGQVSSAGTSYEPDTQLYRNRLDVQFWDGAA